MSGDATDPDGAGPDGDADANRGGSSATGDDPESRLYPFSPTTMTTLFYLALFVWAAVMMALARDWSWEDRLFPMVFTGIALVLIAAQLTVLHFGDRLERFVPDTAETGSDEMEIQEDGDEGRVGRVRERYELIMIGWAVALPLSLYVIGFLYAIPLYTFAFVWYFNRNLRTAALAAALATALVYGLFAQVLGIRLPTGVLFG